MLTCEDCDRPTPQGKWGKIRAQAAGWFFQKDGSIYCPEHVPDWVKDWRDKNREK